MGVDNESDQLTFCLECGKEMPPKKGKKYCRRKCKELAHMRRRHYRKREELLEYHRKYNRNMRKRIKEDNLNICRQCFKPNFNGLSTCDRCREGRCLR